MTVLCTHVQIFLCAAIWRYYRVGYEISNRGFLYFLRTYYCDFLNDVYIGREVCSLVVMGNGQSRHCF